MHYRVAYYPSTGTGYEDDTIQCGLHQAMSSVDAPRKLPRGIHELNLPPEGRIIENVKMDVPCRMDSPLRSTAYHVCKTDKI